MTAPIKRILKNSESKFRSIKQKLRYYYLRDERPFAIGYSGGKDSTVTLGLTTDMLLDLKKSGITLKREVFVQFSDTMMEMDNTIAEIEATLNRLEKFAIKYDLPIVVKRVKPVTEETFFSLLIGKGYQLPTEARWCTDRLKIRPQNRLMDEYGEKYPQGMLAVVGMRAEESDDRKKNLEKLTIDGIYKEHNLKNWNMLTPIEDITTEDVWNYIFDNTPEWLDSKKLALVYADAADDGDECRTMLEGESGQNAGCRNSQRYGCWVCPKQRSKDKVLNTLSKTYNYIKKMEVFRNWLMEEGTGWKNRRVYRNDNHGRVRYNRDGHRKNMTNPSGYTMEFRKEILKRLWNLEQEIKKERVAQEPLISYSELVYIQNEWIKEGDFNLSVEDITGVKLDGLNIELLNISKKIDKMLLVEPDPSSRNWFPAYYRTIPCYKRPISRRWIAVFVAEMLKNSSDEQDILRMIENLYRSAYDNKERIEALEHLNSMKITQKKFFPTDLDEKCIRMEWNNDSLDINTYVDFEVYKNVRKPDEVVGDILNKDYKKKYKKALKEYEPFAEVEKKKKELEEKGDITLCETISLEEQMSFFDNYHSA